MIPKLWKSKICEETLFEYFCHFISSFRLNFSFRVVLVFGNVLKHCLSFLIRYLPYIRLVQVQLSDLPSQGCV